MSIVFDPFTGQIIDTGSSGGAPSIGGPVLGANPNAILVTDGATNLADIQLDNGEVLIGKTGDAPVAATLTGTPNQINIVNGANSITISTPQDINSTASPTFSNLNLNPGAIIDVNAAGILEFGITNATVINIGNAGADVNIYGDTVYQNVTNLNVTDKNITVNNGGSAYTSFNAGIHVYDGGVADKGYLEVTPDMLGWDMKAPYADGVIVFNPGAVGFTINQGSHNPITIATPANGLAVDGNQELSIELASALQNGALSSADWTTFNNKQSEFAFKVKAYDPVSATLPTVDPVVVDGYTVLDGDNVLFSNLTNPAENNKIYIASISAGVVSWTENVLFIPNVNDYVLVENGTAFAIQSGVFNGTSFDFNRVIRHFNGVDYWEQSAIYAVALVNNTPNNVFTISYVNSENMIVDFSITRGTNKTTGTLYITTDGTTAKLSDVGVDLVSPVGVTFELGLNLLTNEISLTCLTDNSGDSGELKYALRRWSDSPGGPGGLPSYTSGGGSSYFTVQETSSTNPTVTFNNINTLNFDNDTGFNVTADGPNTVKVSLGSTFKTWNIDNGAGPVQPSLVAVGEDTVEFIAGTNIEFVTDNTLGSKSFTINSTGGGGGEVNTASNVGAGTGVFKQKTGVDLEFKTLVAGSNITLTPATDTITIAATGGGPTVNSVTLSNGASNTDVTGFIVDPTIYDAFEANITITRDVPSGIVVKGASPLGFGYNTILQLTDGSAILYNNDGSSYQILKVDSSGNTDATFNVGLGFNGGITKIIDVTEDSTNSVLAVFGAFTAYNGFTRQRVCFIDGNTGADLFDLYDGFGIASGGSGFSSGTVLSVTKIKYTSNIASSTSPYGYLIIGNMDYFNDMSMTTPLTSKAIIVSAQRGQGYVEIPNGSSFATTSYLLTPANKSVGTTAFSIDGTTTLPSVPWSDAQEFFYKFGTTSNQIYANDFSGSINMGMGYNVATASSMPMGTGYVYSMDTNSDGSVLFIGGDFTLINSTSIKSFAKINVTSISSTTLDLSFNPLSAEMSSIVYKVSAADTLVTISGTYIQNLSVCQNYSVLNYDGSVNTAALNGFGTGFPTFAVPDFSSSYFLQYSTFPDLANLYGYSAITPSSYIAKIYGCNEYVGVTPEMNLQGYAYSGGTYPGVTFTMDGATGQLKYTATNITGGTPTFTMKYLLTAL
jgi:hypothetical protein